MDDILALYLRVRKAFPQISVSADRFHEKRFGGSLEGEPGVEYAWFEALADSFNEEMRRDVPYEIHRAAFQLLACAFDKGAETVKQCIDVAFVENLFWQVPSAKCAQYWEQLPPKLKQLYTEFHHREPP